MSGLLDIVVLVNNLLQLVTSAGLAWQDVKPLIDKAHAEGRPFQATDLLPLIDKAEKALAKLRADIAAAP